VALMADRRVAYLFVMGTQSKETTWQT